MEPIRAYFDLAGMAGVDALIAKADAAARSLAACGEPKDAERRIGIEGYEEWFLARMVHGSAAIEGSALTLAETSLVLDRDFVPRDRKQRDDMMSAIGIADAFRYAMRQAKAGRALSPSLMQDIHERVSIDMDDSIRGALRATPVRVKGSASVPPEPRQVGPLLEALARLATDADLHPLLSVAATHKAFEAIHPFADGNGRTGRALMNFQLASLGYPPVAIDAGRRGDYLSALEEWDVGRDLRPLVSLICEQVAIEAENRRAILGSPMGVASLRTPRGRIALTTDEARRKSGTHGEEGQVGTAFPPRTAEAQAVKKH